MAEILELESVSEKIHQLVGFVVAGEEFGVEILRVREIIRLLDVTRVPNSPDFIEGVINLRGKIVPIIDLRKRFGLERRQRDKETRIIVVELSDKVIGFLVDKVREVIRVESSIIEPPPTLASNVGTHYITGVAKLEDRLLTLLDLNRVLSIDEHSAVAGLEE